MQFFFTFAALLPLLTIASDQYNRYPNPEQVACSPWTDQPGMTWKDLGELTHSDYSQGAMLNKWDHKMIIDNRDNGHSNLWYGIYAGVVNTTAYYAQVDLKPGDGQGQQFRIAFKDANNQIVNSFWMTPGHYCTYPLGKVWHRSLTSVQVYKRNKYS